MKLKSKLMAAAIALVAASGAQADITPGTGAGNGELFFNIWDANGSYTRGLGSQINTFQTTLAALGNIDLSWAADSTFTSFLAGTAGGTRSGALQWNIVANDNVGANRLLTTYTLPEQALTKPSNVIFSASGSVTTFLNKVNPLMAGANLSGDSLAVDSASLAFAGQTSFNNNFGGLIDFSNGGTLANNSYTSGLGFMRIDAAQNNGLPSVYNEYLEGTTAVNAWLDASNTLHIAAIPEPSEYALMLAGLGMLGFMARRRLNNRV